MTATFMKRGALIKCYIPFLITKSVENYIEVGKHVTGLPNLLWKSGKASTGNISVEI
jgi:hypothetical protein